MMLNSEIIKDAIKCKNYKNTESAFFKSTPFLKIADVNQVLKPYWIKAFNVSSMKTIDFEGFDGTRIVSLLNKTVKTISLSDLVEVIEAKNAK